MCGICGFVGNGNKSILINMREKMVHRGPDDAGIYLNLENQIGLGHRRLSIIDLSERGRQPMESSSGENVITYNGEVYNYLEIKRELEKNGIYFRSNTDTEVVLEAIQYWGIKAINKFHGMFAIAIWNKSKKELLLIRDRLGIKPLYYSITQSGIVFASEIKALLEHPEVPKDLNYNALDCYLKVDYIPGNRTIFKYVHKLLPAHYLTYKQGDININKYWNLRFTKEKRSVTSWMDELEDEILSSVKARMIADVPIGAFLSGGIDSTIILTAMARISKEPVKTFTIGFTDDMYDESQYAKFVAERNNAKSYYKIIEPQIDFDLLKRLIYQADEPLADGSLMPTYLVCKASKDYAKVILSGDGGDETFLGYEKYERFLNYELSRKKLKIPSSTRFYEIIKKLPIAKRSIMLRYLNDSSYRYAELTYGYFSKSYTDIYGDGLNFKTYQNDKESLDWLVLDEHKSGSSALNTAQMVDYQSYLPDDILMKVDKMSMVNSLEVRVPLLEHRIQELAARLPDSLKLRQGVSKFILKELLKRWDYPEDFIYRRKKGFAPSNRFWFTSENKKIIIDDILNGLAVKEKIFSKKYLTKRINKKDYNPVWRVWIFEQWYGQYFN